MPITTPIGTAVYPHLNEPDTKFEDDGVYTTQLRLTAEEAEPVIEKLESMYETEYDKFCKEKKKPKLKQADRPWSEEYDDEGNETGHYLFRFKMKAKTRKGAELRPVLFDSKCQPLSENIGGGSKMKVSFEPHCWLVPALGVGISLRLRGVQVLELIEYGGASAKSLGFGEEDGFESTAASLSATEETETADYDF
jgi:hypothetical protein